MSVLRMLWRLPCLLLCLLGIYGSWLLTRPVALFSRRWGMAITSAVFQSGSRWAGRIAGMRIEVEGEPPSPPCFLVSNHLSYMDVVVLASQLPCFFVSRADVARWPGIGALVSALNTIFIERERRGELPEVVRRMEQILDRGYAVAFFPEGTSSKGDGVMPFRAPLFEAAARSGHPVYAASLAYHTPPSALPAHLSICWWGDMPFTGHLLQMLRQPGFVARVRFSEEPLLQENRKELAATAQQIVGQLFVPSAPADSPCPGP